MPMALLPLSEAPRQAFTLDTSLNGEGFLARFDLRFLPAVNRWVISLWDGSSGALLVNQVPLVCSRGQVNDLFRPFRHLREGKGCGALWVLRCGDEGPEKDPSENNLSEYTLLFGDVWNEN
ncbi:MAG: hypothetical protein IKO25_02360 [Clostridia bacterium]|nr:hypothetical protein [Clostridia bacterium]